MKSLEFHHIGVACKDIESETKISLALGYEIEGEDFVDPAQGVYGRFLVGGGPRLELLAPLTEKGVLTPWLNQGVKLYHLAYLTEELESEMQRLRASRAKVMVPPIPAVAFGGRKIAFLMLPNMLLVELIEK